MPHAGTKADRKQLSEQQKIILKSAEIDDRITILKMTELLPSSDKTIRRDIKS